MSAVAGLCMKSVLFRFGEAASRRVCAPPAASESALLPCRICQRLVLLWFLKEMVAVLIYVL